MARMCAKTACRSSSLGTGGGGDGIAETWLGVLLMVEPVTRGGDGIAETWLGVLLMVEPVTNGPVS